MKSPNHRRRGILLALLTAAVLILAACASASASGHGASTAALRSSSTSSTSTTATTAPKASTTTTTTNPMQAPMQQPTKLHPLTILEIGDSLGEDLGFGLGDDVFASDPYVHVLQDAVGDTGLARPDYYNWPAHLEAELQSDHPGAVIVFIGGNDGQSFDQNGEYVGFGTALWHRVYASRVALMMRECLAAKARVLWVGMPIMQDPTFAAVMQLLNAIYKAQAARHPGVTYFSSWPVLASASGTYTESIIVNGQTELLRDPDGVHIANYGGDLLASSLVAPMEKSWGIKLFPPGKTVGTSTST
ncbi:MAG: DUF459 domain-containing protein [Acidimicrobiales bacterium]